ncbi:MAG: InlB B-repeat-containing protein [Bacillota bacterium]|nr:InlB B-repeat-containing protein [Bacillota bacterium]
MKKTLSFLLVMLMVLTLVAIPAMASDEIPAGGDSSVEGQAITSYPHYYKYADLSSYADGTTLCGGNASNTGLIKYAGTGATNITIGGTEYTSYNKLNITDNEASQGVASDDYSKVTVETVNGEKVLKLATSNENASGIALQPLTGAALADGAIHYGKFAFYQPDEASQVHKVSLGLANDTGSTLSYFEVNSPQTDNATLFGEPRYGTSYNINSDPGTMALTSWDQTVASPATNYIRHTNDTGAYMGDSTGTNLSVDNCGEAATTPSLALSNWYYVRYGLQYVPGVGIRVYLNDSMNVDPTSYTGSISGIIPLTTTELANFSSMNIAPVISAEATGTDTTRYIYVKNIAFDTMTNALGNYNYKKVTALGTEALESYATGATSISGSSALGLIGVGTTNMLKSNTLTSLTGLSTKIVANPNNKGNNSAEVIDVHVDGGIAKSTISAGYEGWKTKAIPSTAFTTGENGATIYYDTYANCTTGFDAGRIHLFASDANGVRLGTVTDGNDTCKTVDTALSIVGSNNSVKYVVNTGVPATSGLLVSTTISSGWYRVAINIKPTSDGTSSYIRIRTKDLNSNTWGSWGSYTEIPMQPSASSYWTLSCVYNMNPTAPNTPTTATSDVYFDNFAVQCSKADQPLVYSADGGYTINAGSTVKVAFNVPVAGSSMQTDNVRLVDSTSAVVPAKYTWSVENGKEVLTILPNSGLSEGAKYTVALYGATDTNGQVIPDVSFIVAQDGQGTENPPVASCTSNKIVYGDTEYVELNLADTPVGTAYYSVTSSDPSKISVTEDAGNDRYALNVAGNGNATITVKNLLYPGAGTTTYDIQAVKPTTTYTVSYYVDNQPDKTEIVGANCIPDGYAPTFGGNALVGWATSSGSQSVVPLSKVTANTSYYGVFNTPVTLTFETNGYGTVGVSSVAIATGGKLTAIPELTPNRDDFTFAGWEINGTTYSSSQLLTQTFSADTTIKAVFAETRINECNYDFTTMTADEFDVTPFKANAYGTTSYTLTPGSGITLNTTAAAIYKIPFIRDITSDAFEMDYEFIETASAGVGGFDGFFYLQNEGSEVQTLYHGANAFSDRMAVGGVPSSTTTIAYPDSDGKADGQKHTVKYIIDKADNIHMITLDGVSLVEGDTATETLRNQLIPYSFQMTTKAGGTFKITKFSVKRYAHYKAPLITATLSSNVTSVNITSPKGLKTITSKHVPVGDKVRVATVLNDGYSLNTWTATSGTFENPKALTTYYIAGSNDDTIGVNAIVTPETVTATFDVGSHGTIVSGDAQQAIAKGETPVAPTIQAEAGYRFDGWSPTVGAINADTTYTAQYTQLATIDINFNVNNSKLATIASTAKAVEGGSIISLPTRTALHGSTFLYWKGADGTHYTDNQLLALTFSEPATFTAVYSQKYAEDGVFDFTTQDINEFFGTFTLGRKYTVNPDGSLHFGIPTGSELNTIEQISAAFDSITTGTVVFTIDYKYTSGGGINSDFLATDGSSTQGLFVVGDKILCRRAADGIPVENPAATGLAPRGDGKRHVVKVYFDLDHNTYRQSVDGKFTQLVNPNLRQPGKGLKNFGFSFKELNDFDLYKMGAEILDTSSLTACNFTTSSYDYSSTCFAYPYTGTAYAGEQVYYKANLPASGYKFDGWYVNDELYTTDTNFALTASADANVVPKYSIKNVTLNYVVGDHGSFSGMTDKTWAATMQQGLTPGASNVPTVVVDDGYKFLGWRATYIDGQPNEGGDLTSPDTIANAATTTDYTWSAVVVPIKNVTISGGNITSEIGRTVSVPVSATISDSFTEAVIDVTFDNSALQYAGAIIPEALADKVVVAQTATPTVLEITVSSATPITLNDVIASLKFKILTITDGSDITFTLSSINYGVDEVDIESNITAGKVVSAVLKGDANQDGKIDVYDAVTILKYIVGTASLTDNGLKAANVIGTDEQITITDATTVLKYIARLITNF